MSRIDDEGPKYPWGNDEWPGMKPDTGQSGADWGKQVIYDDTKLEGVLSNLRSAHDALVKAAEHLPKDINPAEFGPPTGQRLASDSKQASDHLQTGFTAFLSAWGDLITKVEGTKAKHYSSEDANKQRVAQNNDWK
ncbi:hypothetical protein [Actinomadura sp. DC4]|uniref:hypothetical protein n=1 Tax=Actinomadura sp. DC4 TaxID=3055069 RepID=UPI0025B0B8F4|nr:hypothetical protein [Actinomadura sp. DC4]MDN3359717.1 hypothetical protein [Actinomadura sp. DC4]